MDTPVKPSSSQDQQLTTIELSSAPSWGERLLPYLFAALECCCIDIILIAIAFHSQELVIPLWAPFLLIASAYSSAQFLLRRSLILVSEDDNRASVTVGSAPIFLVTGFIGLLVIWASIYASTAWIIDPRWLLMLLNDLLLLNGNFFHILGLVMLSMYFCWRGIRLSRRPIDPSEVLRALYIGLGLIIVVVLLRVASPTLLIFIPLILAFSLISHALSKALFVRRTALQKSRENVVAQEGSIFAISGAIAVLLLLIALALGSFTTPAVLMTLQQALAPLGIAYRWLISQLADAVVFLLSPLFWLLSLFHPQKLSLKTHQTSPTQMPGRVSNQAPQSVLVTAFILKIILPVLGIIIVAVLIRWALRRRRIMLVRCKEEIHESLWSWSLFWTQLKAFFHNIWLRWFSRHSAEEKVLTMPDEEFRQEPAALNIRKIYRALLKWAAGRGYPRKKDETPYEFTARLHQHLPMAEPELSTVTQAYTDIRYGQVIPAEAEVADVQRAWLALQQKSR